RFETELELPGEGLLRAGLDTSSLDLTDPYGGNNARFLNLTAQPLPPLVTVVSGLGQKSPALRAVTAIGNYRIALVDAWDPELASDLVIVEAVADPFAGLTAKPGAVLWLGSAPGVTDLGTLPRRDPTVTSWDGQHPASRKTTWGTLEAAHVLELPDRAARHTLVDSVSVPVVQLFATSQR